MKKRKFYMNRGLNSEKEDMEKLSKFAKEGWLLEKVAPLGFGLLLRKAEPENIIYNVDFQEEVDDEYFQFFEEAGWNHVCSARKALHFFYAPYGTKPIYSDVQTYINKFEDLNKRMKKTSLSSLK